MVEKAPTDDPVEPADAVDVRVREVWDELVASVIVSMDDAHPSVAVSAAQSFQDRFAAAELRALDRLAESGASERNLRQKASAGGSRSKKSASKATKRASAVGRNPELGKDLENGSLGEERLDAIAEASDKTDGDAANDPELLDDVKSAPADDAEKITRRWLEKRDPHGGESRYERQRRRRNARRSHDARNGLETIELSGDRESVEGMWGKIQVRAGELYESDGGRDVPADQHPRTRGQRLFDAAVSLLTRGADPAAVDGSAGSRAAGPRAMMHCRVTVDETTAEVIRVEAPDGSGVLPRSVFERFACDAVWATTIFGVDGATLWHGHSVRFATPEQYTALVARDGGCVKCGADARFCEVHHLTPVNSPVRGETNIDELALVCDDCHHQIHANNLILYWQLGPPRPDGIPRLVWETRPATPAETPRWRHDHRPKAA